MDQFNVHRICQLLYIIIDFVFARLTSAYEAEDNMSFAVLFRIKAKRTAAAGAAVRNPVNLSTCFMHHNSMLLCCLCHACNILCGMNNILYYNIEDLYTDVCDLHTLLCIL